MLPVFLASELVCLGNFSSLPPHSACRPQIKLAQTPLLGGDCSLMIPEDCSLKIPEVVIPCLVAPSTDESLEWGCTFP